MPPSYIMTPDISSPAASDDVISVFKCTVSGCRAVGSVFATILSLRRLSPVLRLVGWCHLHCVREQECADQMVLTNKQSVIAQTDSGCVWKCHKVAACVLSPQASVRRDSLILPQTSSGPSSSEEIQAQRLDRKSLRDKRAVVVLETNKNRRIEDSWCSLKEEVCFLPEQKPNQSCCFSKVASGIPKKSYYPKFLNVIFFCRGFNEMMVRLH